MKRAQGPLGVVIGLSVLVVLLFIFVFIFRPPSTGQVVSEFEENTEQEQAKPEETNFISEPFELRAWVISSDGIRLDIRNKGQEDYIIRVLDISNCGAENQDQVIAVGESRILEVKCNLESGGEFEGDISLVYSKIASEETAVSKGKVRDLV